MYRKVQYSMEKTTFCSSKYCFVKISWALVSLSYTYTTWLFFKIFSRKWVWPIIIPIYIYICWANRKIKLETYQFKRNKNICRYYLIYGCIQFTSNPYDWEQISRVNTIAYVMTRNRLFELRFNFYVIDNNTIPINNTDRFIKVRKLFIN
jgi:hypothetical protein